MGQLPTRQVIPPEITQYLDGHEKLLVHTPFHFVYPTLKSNLSFDLLSLGQ